MATTQAQHVPYVDQEITESSPRFEVETIRWNSWHEFDGSQADVLKMADVFLASGWVIDHLVLTRPDTKDRAHFHVWRQSPRVTTYAAAALRLLRRFTERAACEVQ